MLSFKFVNPMTTDSLFMKIRIHTLNLYKTKPLIDWNKVDSHYKINRKRHAASVIFKDFIMFVAVDVVSFSEGSIDGSVGASTFEDCSVFDGAFVVSARPSVVL